MAPERARERGVPAVRLGGRVSVHLPCTCVQVRVCMQNSPGRAADLIFLSPSKAPTLEMAWGDFFSPAMFSSREWAQKSLVKERARGVAGLACLLLVPGVGEGWVLWAP